MNNHLLALTGATALVGDTMEPCHGATVLIQDGRIAAVGPDVAIPQAARILHLPGRTVLPGLIDSHVHLGPPETTRGVRPGLLARSKAVVDWMRFQPGKRRGFLRHGVTTVCSLGDENDWVHDFRRKSAVAELVGPRLLIAGPIFTSPGGHPVATVGARPDADWVRVPRSPDQAREQVGALVTGADPVDVVKVVHDRGDPRRTPLEPLEPAILQAIVEQAHHHGKKVAAHWGTLEDLAELLAAGVDGLHHLEPRGPLRGWPPHLLTAMVDSGVTLAPTLAVTDALLDGETAALLRSRVAEFHEAGGTLIAASDSGMPSVHAGSGLIRDIALLARSGLTAREAVRAATSAPAQALGTDQIGAVEAGRAADLLVVDGDPLARLDALRAVVMVLREGRIVVDRTSRKHESHGTQQP
ncbi:amidohydrolase [Microtetraspora sp. NBRC 13810]|uniref:amidohydrolase family protein n=1 Tax=Microtetraspora sp. NBRC 13810 TaxID=3030990 RepID=UPI0024A50AEF|nr:amidohydrolase family protein [Microtetraspora sp. NBRC 13810]GLW10684.1 amidohydrolase [Microtetraspora sp. NBRC 13810]